MHGWGTSLDTSENRGQIRLANENSETAVHDKETKTRNVVADEAECASDAVCKVLRWPGL